MDEGCSGITQRQRDFHKIYAEHAAPVHDAMDKGPDLNPIQRVAGRRNDREMRPVNIHKAEVTGIASAMPLEGREALRRMA